MQVCSAVSRHCACTAGHDNLDFPLGCAPCSSALENKLCDSPGQGFAHFDQLVRVLRKERGIVNLQSLILLGTLKLHPKR